jgi:hypothetical protein
MGLGLGSIVAVLIDQAPGIIALVGRLLGDSDGPSKRAAAAKELFEAVKLALDEDWQLADLGELNSKKLLKAIEDEEVFVEKLANVNDAIYEFSKYIENQEVE